MGSMAAVKFVSGPSVLPVSLLVSGPLRCASQPRGATAACWAHALPCNTLLRLAVSDAVRKGQVECESVQMIASRLRAKAPSRPRKTTPESPPIEACTCLRHVRWPTCMALPQAPRAPRLEGGVESDVVCVVLASHVSGARTCICSAPSPPAARAHTTSAARLLWPAPAARGALLHAALAQLHSTARLRSARQPVAFKRG